MKRSPMPPRKTPLKRTGRLNRRTRKRMSDDETYLAIRDVYLEQNPYCVCCGTKANQIHHVLRGANRQRALLNSDTWLAVCGSVCHDAVEAMSWTEQVVLKQNRIMDTVERLRR